MGYYEEDLASIIKANYGQSLEEVMVELMREANKDSWCTRTYVDKELGPFGGNKYFNLYFLTEKNDLKEICGGRKLEHLRDFKIEKHMSCGDEYREIIHDDYIGLIISQI